MRSLFGWSYPPGAANDPNAPWNQETPPCDVCGNTLETSAGGCICQECHICGVAGDPLCYEYHGLIRTQAQIDGRLALEAEYQKQAEADRAEAEYWTDPQRAVEAAQMDEYWRDLERHNNI